MNLVERQEVTILFAGDSGDGMQLTGSQFTNTAARLGNDISTFPDFPAEIRAPGGTVAGVSGFKLHFGSIDISSPGDECDVLVVMNAAALKKNIYQLKEGGTILANISGFDKKNLKLAKYENDPLEKLEEDYQLHKLEILKQTQAALKEFELSNKFKSRAKNMFALGFVYWLFSRPLDFTESFLEQKFGKDTTSFKANLAVLKAGYQFGEISDTFTERYEIGKAEMPKGVYRNISGNHALSLGLITAADKSHLDLFYAGYPITPASDILHHLASYKHLGAKTFQAEDEIAAVSAAIGASYGGDLGITASSGPGIALKVEAMGLAVILELPLVVINVQRGGPSTGLPTKTEQADLLQAMYSRNGEAPLPVIAAKSPSDCFEMAFWAVKIALEFMTPVVLLSDGYLANGAEPWKVPKLEQIPAIKTKKTTQGLQPYMPYVRDNNLVRDWVVPGVKGLEHRIGGLEKEDGSGNISYEAQNHEKMVGIRKQKVLNIQHILPKSEVEPYSAKNAEVLILAWGSTYGAIRSAFKKFKDENFKVAHLHLQFINPFPKDLEPLLRSYKHIIIPELNAGQLAKLIRQEYLIDAQQLNKIQGQPFTSTEIFNAVTQSL